MPKDRPHVAIYLYSLGSGGAERVIMNLIHSFVQLVVCQNLIKGSIFPCFPCRKGGTLSYLSNSQVYCLEYFPPSRPCSPCLSQLNQLVNELGVEKDVAMPGFIKNPYNYMKQAAVFVLSSAWEGLPNVLIEAMALDTPVVATNCPSGPEEILAGGKYGKLVPVGDEDKMAEAILSVLSGNFQPVDSNWLEQFTQETAMEKYLDVLGIAEN